MEYQEPTPRRGMPAWAIALLGCGGCFVIAIPILAAILFPVFAKAKEQARKSACMTNLRECALALQMYSNDWNGFLPYSVSPANDEVFETAPGPLNAPGGPDSWAARVLPYRKNREAFICPSDSGGPNTISYHYKHAINEAARQGLTERDFSYPMEQVLLYERGSFHYGGGPIVDGSHVNVAYVDGHVKTVRMVNISPQGEPRYFNAVAPGSAQGAKQTPPYKDPRCCIDRLY